MLNTKLIISVSVFVTLCSVLYPSSTVLAQNNETGISTADILQYDNPNLGFSLKYPSDWAKEESLTFISPQTSKADQAPESISISTEMLPINLTLEQYSNSAINMLAEQFPNFTIIGERYATLSGFDAYMITYTYTEDAREIQLMQIWTVVDGIAYVLTYGGVPDEFNDSLPVLEDMIDSFQITGLNQINQQQAFASAFDTFVTSPPQGYGIYQVRDSNIFSLGEDILLYIEPVGFEYGTLTDEQNNTLYSIDFTADFTISDTEGNILAGQQGLPVSDIISHYQNEEVFIPFTISQTNPFPPGNYIITYTIHDNNSGNSFDIAKEIAISEEQSF